MSEPNELTSDQIRSLGIVQEINRQLLHPMGLAMFVQVYPPNGRPTVCCGIYDMRDDSEGLVFEACSPVRAAAFAAAFEERRIVREQRFGWHVQPATVQVTDLTDLQDVSAFAAVIDAPENEVE